MSPDFRQFAILEHEWNGVHWDFLIENGPTLRTWAINEPLVAGRDLPARILADHRLIYLEYEGEIADNRGFVRRWDSGSCEVLIWSDDFVQLRLQGTQIEGVVEFRCELVEEARRWLFRWGKLS